MATGALRLRSGRRLPIGAEELVSMWRFGGLHGDGGAAAREDIRAVTEEKRRNPDEVSLSRDLQCGA